MSRYAISMVLAVVCWGCATSNSVPAPAPAPVQDARMGRGIESVLTDATVAVRVIELPSGRELYAKDADRPMMPASNMKVLTSATGLDVLGADYAFRTTLAVKGDDLYLIGSGDPGLGDPTIAGWANRKPTDDFAPFAEALRARGVTRVRGDLYYDDRVLDDQRIAPQWSKGFRDFWYAAPVSGLNFNDNCIDVTVHPTRAGEAARVEVVPPTAGLVIENACVTGEKNAPSIRRGAGPNEYVVSGTCSTKTALASKPVEDPGQFTADALKTYLAGRGIAIDGRVVRAPAGAGGGAEVVAVRETPMASVLKRLNKNSQNMFAEAVSKLCGRAHARDHGGGERAGSWADGEAAVRAFLARQGVDGTALVAVDGSGLARENRVTARMLTDLLAAMSKHPRAEVFKQSLPEAGVDGTLRRRMPEMKGRVFAKTGSIGGVRALSGYATTAEGKTVAFSILCNEIKGDDDAYVKKIDEAVGVIVGKGEMVAVR